MREYADQTAVFLEGCADKLQYQRIISDYLSEIEKNNNEWIVQLVVSQFIIRESAQ